MQPASHHHSAIFVIVSLIVAILGSWTALDLFRRVRSHVGRTRQIWLAASALALGVSIWSMHFIAMLGFDPGSPVSYNLPLTFLSLALAIGSTCGAFFAVAREKASLARLGLAGVVMGLGICLMHYVGMAALRSAVSLAYRPAYVAASLTIAVVASFAALAAAKRNDSAGGQAFAAIVLGLAIAGMHYTAMAGLQVTRAAGAPAALAGAPPLFLGLSVASGALVIMMLALLASLYDQRLDVLAALEGGGVGYWELSIPDMTLHLSRRGKAIFGVDANAPFTQSDFLAALAPADRDRRDSLLSAAIAEGREYNAEYQLTGPGGAPRWINIRGRTTGRTGRYRRMVGVVLDVTERYAAFAALAEAERRQRMLIDELNHRVKNTLATVQSLARQTAKGATSLEGFREDFESRLVGLSQTHNVLTRSSWASAGLRDLILQELRPHGIERVRLAGSSVDLPPKAALAVGLVLHELATNAAKYGALSVPGGTLEVVWNQVGDALSLEWSERGGPAAETPDRVGFGTRLIRQVIEGELGGRASLTYAAEGFCGRFTFPIHPTPEWPAKR